MVKDDEKLRNNDTEEDNTFQMFDWHWDGVVAVG